MPKVKEKTKSEDAYDLMCDENEKLKEQIEKLKEKNESLENEIEQMDIQHNEAEQEFDALRNALDDYLIAKQFGNDKYSFYWEKLKSYSTITYHGD